MMRTIVPATLVLAALAPTTASAQAEVTANVGWVSEYYYRGIPQNSSSASAGLDVAAGLFSAGTWAADVDDGNEVDLYASLGADVGALSLSVGGTGYFYTGDFDNTYLELNLGAGFGPISVAYAIGTYDSEPESTDYGFGSVTAESMGFYATVGKFFQDFFENGVYGEVGYGFTAGDMDFSAAWIISDENLSLMDKTDHTLVFGVGKTFTLAP